MKFYDTKQYNEGYQSQSDKNPYSQDDYKNWELWDRGHRQRLTDLEMRSRADF